MTARELEVVRLAGEGNSIGGTARELKVSPSRVKQLRQGAADKLGGRNITHTVALAMQAGLISYRLSGLRNVYESDA